MKLYFTCTTEDYIQFNEWFQLQLDTTKNQFKLVRFSFIVIAAICLAFLLLSGAMFNNHIFAIFLLGIISYCVFYIATYKKNWKRSFRSQIISTIREGRYTEFFEPATIELKDNQIQLERAQNWQFFSYSAVQSIENNANCLYLMLGSASACIIPLSAFENEHQKQLFISIIMEKASLTQPCIGGHELI